MFLLFLFFYLAYLSLYDYLYLKILHKQLLVLWFSLEIALHFHLFPRLSWTETMFNFCLWIVLFFCSLCGKGLGMGDVKFLFLLAFYLPFFPFVFLLLQSLCFFLFFYFLLLGIAKFKTNFLLPQKLPFLPFYCPFLFLYFFSI